MTHFEQDRVPSFGATQVASPVSLNTRIAKNNEMMMTILRTQQDREGLSKIEPICARQGIVLPHAIEFGDTCLGTRASISAEENEILGHIRSFTID